MARYSQAAKPWQAQTHDPVELVQLYGASEPGCWCELCGGALMLLGQLGTRIHLRCRDCGMQYNQEER